MYQIQMFQKFTREIALFGFFFLCTLAVFIKGLPLNSCASVIVCLFSITTTSIGYELPFLLHFGTSMRTFLWNWICHVFLEGKQNRVSVKWLLTSEHRGKKNLYTLLRGSHNKCFFTWPDCDFRRVLNYVKCSHANKLPSAQWHESLWILEVLVQLQFMWHFRDCELVWSEYISYLSGICIDQSMIKQLQVLQSKYSFYLQIVCVLLQDYSKSK